MLRPDDAKSETYSDYEIPELPDGQGKCSKRYEALFRIAFDFEFIKRKVAETIKKLLEDKNADEESLEQLKSVTDALLTKLRAQTP